MPKPKDADQGRDMAMMAGGGVIGIALALELMVFMPDNPGGAFVMVAYAAAIATSIASKLPQG